MPHRLFRKILVAYDGSKPSDRAFENGLALALLAESDLHVISVCGDAPRFPASIDELEDYKEAAEAHYGDLHRDLQVRASNMEVSLDTHIQHGDVVRTIAAFTKENHVDLLVIGAVGRSSVLKKLAGKWGSTAESLARLAPCTVLMVK